MKLILNRKFFVDKSINFIFFNGFYIKKPVGKTVAEFWKKVDEKS